MSSGSGVRKIKIGVMGAGVVGCGTLDLLARGREQISRAVGGELVVDRVLVRDLRKDRGVAIPERLLTDDPSCILDNPEIDVVVELIGGEEPAYSYIAEALRRGKHVVTANKEVIAKYGVELLDLAGENDCNLFYEASVGGGIPIIGVMRHDLVANEITSIQAIVNGTTNFILTAMEEGRDYAGALQQAQMLGYAEADPRNDVEGIDAVYKLAILATLGFHSDVRPQDISHFGITQLHPRDFRYAAEMGYVVKLIAWARSGGDQIEAAVYPMLISRDHHLAAVKGVFNAILLDGDQIDTLMLYGRGAGAKPTASAVVADLCQVGRDILQGVSERVEVQRCGRTVRDFAELESRFYMRMEVIDRPGVFAQIAKVLGEEQVSIASVIQKETDDTAHIAEIVIMTHLAREGQVHRALEIIRTLPPVREVSNFIRVER